MTDRELLEAAAKAAGVLTHGWRVHEFKPGYYVEPEAETGAYRVWNPLTDDGDALRLAVKLGFTVRVYKDRMEPFSRVEGHIPNSPRNANHVICEEEHRGDPERATRRAIVRAAAAIDAGEKHE